MKIEHGQWWTVSQDVIHDGETGQDFYMLTLVISIEPKDRIDCLDFKISPDGCLMGNPGRDFGLPTNMLIDCGMQLSPDNQIELARKAVRNYCNELMEVVGE